ncbi:MAG: T9SS type A sorting domain-containing protein [Ferruginibacter sp.]
MTKNYLNLILIFFISVSSFHVKAQVINTVAGGFNGGGLRDTLLGINAVSQTVDAAGNMYIAVPDRHIVMKLSASGVYTTLAGNGVYGFGGDGGLATSAQLRNPWNIAVDAAGNVFIADNYDNRIRKVTPSGIITTVAGNGIAGFSGDNGLATSAKISGPTTVLTDTAGNIYISDYVNRRVRKVAPNGIIITIAGNGTAGTAGDGGLATLAQLGFVSGISRNSKGEIFIADITYSKIRKVDTAGIITTVAGTGTTGFTGDGGPATSATFNAINGVTVDKLGNIFIADSYNNRIRKINVAGIITTVAGNGGAGFTGDWAAATSAQVYRPVNIAFDTAGDLLITSSYRVRKVTNATGIIKTIAGSGSGGYCGDGGQISAAQFYHPAGITADLFGNIFLVDRDNNRIRKITNTGVITTVAGNGKPGYNGDARLATSAQLNLPTAVAADAAGNLYISDYGNARIRKVTAATGLISTLAGTGTTGFNGDGPGLTTKIFGPDGITVDAAGNVLFADQFNMRIRKITTAGLVVTVAGNGVAGFSGDGGSALLASLNWPKDVKTDLAGNLYIADRHNNRVRKVSTLGIITTVAGNGVAGYGGDNGSAVLASLDPGAVAIDSVGNIYIADTEHERIRKVSTAGIITMVAGKGPTYGDGNLASAALIHTPTSIAINKVGSIFVADYDNHRIRVISPNGAAGMRSSVPKAVVEAPASTIKFSIYPSPAQNTLYVQTPDAGQIAKLEVVDAAGKVQLSQTVSSNQSVLKLQIQQLAPGAYFIRTTDKSNSVIVKQFIKQ